MDQYRKVAELSIPACSRTTAREIPVNGNASYAFL